MVVYLPLSSLSLRLALSICRYLLGSWLELTLPKNLNRSTQNDIVRSQKRMLTFRVDAPPLEACGTGRVSRAAGCVSPYVPRLPAP